MRTRIAPIVVLLALVAAPCYALAAASFEGSVVSVADGDTITVLTAEKHQVRVRLAEIDAPEKKQAFGTQSKKSLSELVFGRIVRVDVKDTDRYGRTVGRVFVDDRDVNAEQVSRGLAWVYRRYSRDPRLVVLEGAAQAAHRGLWADARPIPPWDFRHAAK